MTLLTDNEDFYVLKADKGGKTVIWSKADYKKEAARQLDDPKTYRKLSKEELDAHMIEILKQK